MRSIPESTCFESVTDVFAFILPIYYHRYHQYPTKTLLGCLRQKFYGIDAEGHYPLIWLRIALACAAGSGASVMGRPTTMWLAPAVIASAGVTTRF
jgi:hypothetical protein